MGNLAQAGYCLSMCMNYTSLCICHVLLIDDHACYPHYPMIVTVLVRHRVMNDGTDVNARNELNLIQ